MKKRISSLLLCIALCLSLMPMSAFAEENFEFRNLPTTGVANITVPAGNYYTGVDARDAFILYWGENIKTNGDFLLIDYVDTDINGYHSWMITIENGVPVATDGGFMEYYTTLDLINNTPFYDSWDKWVNGTFECEPEHTHSYTNYVVTAATLTADGTLKAVCDIDGCDAEDIQYIPRISSVKSSTSTYTYNGSVNNPELTVKDINGNKLAEGTDYTVSVPEGRKDAGTYTYMVEFIGKYTGSEEVSFTIKPASISSKVASLSATKYVYSGTAKKPTVKISGLTSGTDYTVAYTSNTKVGKATVTVKGKGNYSGTLTKTFKINPKKAAVSKATPGKKKLTVKMGTKVASTGGATYQIAYKQKGTSKWKYTTTTKQSKVISKLKKGKRYYVKVRAYKTVSKVKYYGAWSKTKLSNKIK